MLNVRRIKQFVSQNTNTVPVMCTLLDEMFSRIMGHVTSCHIMNQFFGKKV